jgi:hypothetical protein
MQKNGHMLHQRVFFDLFWGFPPSNGQNNAFFAHLPHKKGLKKANEFALVNTQGPAIPNSPVPKPKSGLKNKSGGLPGGKKRHPIHPLWVSFRPYYAMELPQKREKKVKKMVKCLTEGRSGVNRIWSFF